MTERVERMVPSPKREVKANSALSRLTPSPAVTMVGGSARRHRQSDGQLRRRVAGDVDNGHRHWGVDNELRDLSEELIGGPGTQFSSWHPRLGNGSAAGGLPHMEDPFSWHRPPEGPDLSDQNPRPCSTRQAVVTVGEVREKRPESRVICQWRVSVHSNVR
jgi:hypothetical protein